MRNDGILGRVCNGSSSTSAVVRDDVFLETVPEKSISSIVAPDKTALQERREEGRSAVSRFLESLNFREYSEVFLQNGWDEWATLLLIDESDLEQLGVLQGHRRRILAELGLSKETASRAASRSALPTVGSRSALLGKADDFAQDAVDIDVQEIDDEQECEFWCDLYKKCSQSKTPQVVTKELTKMKSHFTKETAFAAYREEYVETKKTTTTMMVDTLQEFDTSHARMKHIFSRTEQEADKDDSAATMLKKGLDKIFNPGEDRVVLPSLDDNIASEIIEHCSLRFGKVSGRSDENFYLKLFSHAVKRLRLAQLLALDAWHIFGAGREPTYIWVCDYCTAGTPESLRIVRIVEERSEQLYSNDARPDSTKSFTSQYTNRSIVVFDDEEEPTAAVDFFFTTRKPTDAKSSGQQKSIDPHWKDTWPRWIHLDASLALDRLTILRFAVKYNLHPLAIDDIVDNRTPTKLDTFGDYIFLSLDIATLEKQGEQSNDIPLRIPPRVKVTRSNVAVLLHKGHNSIMTILQNRPDKLSWMARWWQAEEEQLGDESSDDVTSKEDWSLWENLRNEFKHEPARRVRENKAKFLLFTILDKVAEQLRPIAEAYANRLGHMHQHKLQMFPSEWLMELDELQIELVDLARLIRPMKQVLHHLIEEKDTNAEEKMYLEDVDDAIDQFVGDLEQLRVMGRSMEEAYEVYNDRRMNATLFNLSIFGAIFLPAQFITGVYGMNFAKIPELEWENGYEYFWLLEAGCISAGLLLWGISYALNSVGISKRELFRTYCCRWQKKKRKSSSGKMNA